MPFADEQRKNIDVEFIIAANMYVDTLQAVHTLNFW